MRSFRTIFARKPDQIVAHHAQLGKDQDRLHAIMRVGGNLLFPPNCLACGVEILEAGSLCAACWRQLHPITPPFCTRLGLPFTHDAGSGLVSAEALANPPNFERARAAFIYDDIPRKLVGDVKYRDRLEGARFLARQMARAGSSLLDGAELLIPMPLHPARQRKRRFNQAMEISAALCKLTGVPVEPLALRRIKNTDQQVGKSRIARIRNVAGAFAVPEQFQSRIKDRKCLLIDDVLTSGATANSAAKALKNGGADHIDVLTFARVVQAVIDPI